MFLRVKIIFSMLCESRFVLVNFVLRQGKCVCVMVLYQGCEVLLQGFNWENE